MLGDIGTMKKLWSKIEARLARRKADALGNGENMFIIVGLGNPGREYQNTRHNIGFDVIDVLAEQNHIAMDEKKHKAVIGKGVIAGQKAALVKPQTYMNLSGESVADIINFYKINEKKELIVVSDDIDLDMGRIRIRKKGSAGGHNGLKNIILHLGHDEFQRVRMGVGGKPAGWDLADYVLSRYTKEEREIMDEGARRAAEAIEVMIANGADVAMNKYN
jgi:PTH1 family peptidyl-tRNA hydrolase